MQLFLSCACDRHPAKIALDALLLADCNGLPAWNKRLPTWPSSLRVLPCLLPPACFNLNHFLHPLCMSALLFISQSPALVGFFFDFPNRDLSAPNSADLILAWEGESSSPGRPYVQPRLLLGWGVGVFCFCELFPWVWNAWTKRWFSRAGITLWAHSNLLLLATGGLETVPSPRPPAKELWVRWKPEQWVWIHFAGDGRLNILKDVSPTGHMSPRIAVHEAWHQVINVLQTWEIFFVVCSGTRVWTLSVAMSCFGVKRLDTPALESCGIVHPFMRQSKHRFLGCLLVWMLLAMLMFEFASKAYKWPPR